MSQVPNPALNIPERDLVNFAAKAAGLTIEWPRVDDMPPSIMPQFAYWRPRTHGDDALALSAALNIQIEYSGPSGGVVTEVNCYPRGRSDCLVSLPIEDDKVAATRMAIFYSAVLLGMSLSDKID